MSEQRNLGSTRFPATPEMTTINDKEIQYVGISLHIRHTKMNDFGSKICYFICQTYQH